jgi:hypothetical protein
VDVCQPRWALNVTQLLGPVQYPSPTQCRLNKVAATRSVQWSVSDPCGNGVTVAGTVSALDTLPPVISILDYLVPCALQDQCVALYNGGVSPDWSGYATATDQCAGPVSTTYQDVVVEGSVPGCSPLERHWYAADQCGNVAEHVQTIAFEAAQVPQFVVPPNITVECSFDLGTTSWCACLPLSLIFSPTRGA